MLRDDYDMDAAVAIRYVGYLQEFPQHSFWLPKVIEVCLAVSELHIDPSLAPIIGTHHLPVLSCTGYLSLDSMSRRLDLV